jgi:hypothetical protein
VGSLFFLVFVPGIVAGVVPRWLTDWQVQERYAWLPLQVSGLTLLVGGVVVLLHAFVRFVVEGLGTPAPIAPTERLVVGGLYRYVRNPMYLAVAAIIVGQALMFGQPVLLLYTAVSLSPWLHSSAGMRSRPCAVSSESSTRDIAAQSPRGGHAESLGLRVTDLAVRSHARELPADRGAPARGGRAEPAACVA